jgi:hypothetical protein
MSSLNKTVPDPPYSVSQEGFRRNWRVVIGRDGRHQGWARRRARRWAEAATRAVLRWSSARARAAAAAWPGSGPSAAPARSCSASGTPRSRVPCRPPAGTDLDT